MTDAGSKVAGSTRGRLLNTYGPLIGIAVLAFVLLVWAPGSMTAFRLGNLGKYCALALASMGIGLAWGRGGMLVMGQGVFFGLGAYAMAMHMKLEAAGPGEVPDFMTLYGDGTMPSWWEPFRSGAVHRVRHRRPARGGVVRPRVRDPEAPGEGRLLRHPHPGDGGRVRDVADRDDQADRRLQRPEHVHDLLRPQPLRPRGQEEPVPDRRGSGDPVPA